MATKLDTTATLTDWISIHTTLAGGDVIIAGEGSNIVAHFNPHHPRGWRRSSLKFARFISNHFNPHHPRGWRPDGDGEDGEDKIFQSTPPSRVATGATGDELDALGISIHTTLAGGDLRRSASDLTCSISIHTTLAGGDRGNRRSAAAGSISIHTTLAGGDGCIQYIGYAADISIHTTLAGGDSKQENMGGLAHTISIHTTLAGGDMCAGTARRRELISIHTTLAGGDL